MVKVGQSLDSVSAIFCYFLLGNLETFETSVALRLQSGINMLAQWPKKSVSLYIFVAPKILWSHVQPIRCRGSWAPGGRMGKFQLSEPEDIEEIRASSGASWHLKGGNLVSTKFTKKSSSSSSSVSLWPTNHRKKYQAIPNPHVWVWVFRGVKWVKYT